jgi:hypothetical protein
MLVEDQLVGAPATPLNVTELEPWVEPKLAPVIARSAPMVVVEDEMLLMLGT